MKAYYFVPGQDPELIEVEDDYREMQRLVGGYIECLPFRGACILCDEEGACKGDEPSYMVGINGVPTSLYGNLLVVGGGSKGKFTDVTKDDICGIVPLN